MKKTMLLAVLMSVFCTATALYGQGPLMSGSLQVSNQSRDQLCVELTGFQSFDEHIQGDLLLSNLIPGEYVLRIAAHHARPGGGEYYNGRITVRPSQRVIVSVDPYGRSRVSYTADRNSVMLAVDAGRFPGRDHDDRRGGYDRDERGDGRGRNPYGESERGQAMRDADFSRLLSDMKRTAFDDDKLKTVDMAAAYNMFTTAQVASMLNCFSFEDNKLKCVAILRGRITDMRNAHTLAGCFTFQSSKDKLYEILR